MSSIHTSIHTIIGAGPVGCLMACFLKKLGIDSIIYEKRKDPRVEKGVGKSINLTLSSRGLTSLRLLDPKIENFLPCLKDAVNLKGRFIHPLEGEPAYQPYSINPDEEYFSINRTEISNDLITLAENKGIKIVFEHGIDSIDFKNKEAALVDIQGNTIKKINYSVLWGADGSNSKVRSELDRIFPDNTRVLKFKTGYKEYEIPVGEHGPKLSPFEVVHIYPPDGGNFLLALPNADGSFTCTMYSANDQPDCMANISEDEIVDYFTKDFPSLVDLIGPEKLRQDHKTNPFSGLYNVDCQHWNYKGEVVIIGDAAHGVVPFYALGINVGFEGCRHLYNLIKMYRSRSHERSPNWSVIFSEFNRFKEHTDFLMKAAMKNAEELHNQVKSKTFLFEKEVERKLQESYPSQFIEAHALLSFTNVPLSVCGRQFELQEKIVKELCESKSDLSQIDWKVAHNLVKTQLLNVFKYKFWYEDVIRSSQ